SSPSHEDSYEPSGARIDGWRRISGKLEIDPQTLKIEVYYYGVIVNSVDPVATYFDDFRIFPEKGSMKTYVYDPVTLKLMAVLDENNYATFFEYDTEGNLVRTKRETEKGIVTIQENHQGLNKIK
ncbi:MAG: hypothetical protein HYZ42_08960, partial [Bacteroidetes bacterium]|nr:hypothetical protein [Bacteroidota bacterium]